MRGSLVFVIVSVLAILTVFESQARKWGPVFKEGQLVYSCVGKRVIFPWEFQPSPGERILFIRWTFHGYISSDTVAYFTQGDFLPTSDYTDRVEQVGTGGIALKDLTVNDNGNYTIEISGIDVSEDFFTMQGMAALQVAGKLLVEGDMVTLTQMPEAIKVKDTGKWTAALACGKFTHHGVPPFPVYWTTPSGDIIKKSDDFTDGSYILLLANPVRGGNYSCEIPQLFTDEACLPRGDGNEVKATIMVDEIQIRLTLLEAHQADLLRENIEVKSTLGQKTEELNTLNFTLVQRTEELNALSSTLVLLGNETANATELIFNQLASLESEVKDVATPLIAFNAQTTKTQLLSLSQHLKFDKILYNQGNGYDASSGDFIAPVSGTYFFIFHTRTHSEGHARMRTTIKEICITYIYGKYEHGSCHATVHVSKGDKVWMEPTGNGKKYEGYTTSFSGFLISDDPM